MVVQQIEPVRCKPTPYNLACVCWLCFQRCGQSNKRTCSELRLTVHVFMKAELIDVADVLVTRRRCSAPKQRSHGPQTPPPVLPPGARKVVPCFRWPSTGITAQFIAKPKAACALRLQLGGDVEQPWLISK